MLREETMSFTSREIYTDNIGVKRKKPHMTANETAVWNLKNSIDALL
jgi:hypothetical protein